MLKKPDVLLFDCGGVLVDVDRRKSLRQVSWLSLLPQLLINRFSSTRLLKQCLNELHRIKPLQPEFIGITDEYNNQLPTVVCEWLLGTVSNTVLLKQIKDFIASDKQLNTQPTKRDFLLFIVENTLNSQRFVQTLYLKEKMIAFMQRLRQDSNRPQIYLFSNYNDEAFELLLQRFDSLRLDIDGYFVSGKEHCAKPHDAFYDRFMDRFSINPQDQTCLLIDDQLGNRITGTRKGFISIHPDSLFQEGERFHLSLPNNQILTW